MPSQEQLELVAQVVDRFSEPIRQMRGALTQFKKDEATAHGEGARVAQVHNRATQDLQRSMKESAEYVRGVFNPALVGLGIGALGTAEAIKAAGEALRSFATQGRSLDYLSQEIGLTVDQLTQLDAMAVRVGSSSEQMNAGLQHFSFNLDQLHLNRGPLLEFFQQFGIKYGALKQELMRDNPWQAIRDAMKVLPSMTPPERREFIKGLGLDPEMMKLQGDEFNRVLREVQRNVPTWSAEQIKGGKDLANAFDDARESFDRLKKDLAVEFAPGLTAALTRIRDILHDISEMGITKAIEREGLRKAMETLAPYARGGVAEPAASSPGVVTGAIEFFRSLGAAAGMAGRWLGNQIIPGAHAQEGFASPYGGLGGAFASLGRNPNDPGTATEQTQLREALTLERIEQFFTGGGGAGAGSGGGYGGGGAAGIAGMPGSPSGPAVGGRATRSFRDNNPGNIKFGDFARAHGATGADAGGFAIFPNEQAGTAAQRALWESPGYAGLPFSQSLPKWSAGGYSPGQLGVEPGGTFGGLSEDQKKAFLGRQRAAEGWSSGVRGSDNVAGIPKGSDAVGMALDYVGKNPTANASEIDKYLQGQGIDPRTSAWCAAGVNAALRRSGVKGSGSNLAMSFSHWGQAGSWPPHRDDVGYRHRGGLGSGLGHAGLATGRVNSRGEAEFIEANTGGDRGMHMVWEPKGSMMIRTQGIQARALGGPVDPSGRYLVGEHGPEIFSPRSPGVIEQPYMRLPNHLGPIETPPSHHWPKWEPQKQFANMMQVMTGQKISGEAALRISLEGFPRGVKTTTSSSGSLFQEISVDRGRASPWSFMG